MNKFLERRIKNDEPTYSLVYGEDSEWRLIPTDKKDEWEEVQWDYYDDPDQFDWVEIVYLENLILKDFERG